MSKLARCRGLPRSTIDPIYDITLERCLTDSPQCTIINAMGHGGLWSQRRRFRGALTRTSADTDRGGFTTHTQRRTGHDTRPWQWCRRTAVHECEPLWSYQTADCIPYADCVWSLDRSHGRSEVLPRAHHWTGIQGIQSPHRGRETFRRILSLPVRTWRCFLVRSGCRRDGCVALPDGRAWAGAA